MRRVVAAVLFVTATTYAQQTPVEQTTGAPLEQTSGGASPGQAGNAGSGEAINPGSLLQQVPLVAQNSPLNHDLDLLRRDGFSVAEQASVSLKIFDKAGVTPGGLQSEDFTLIVNGTPRAARVHAPGSQTTAIAPIVLLVFPPNQPIVHNIAVRQAVQYFSQQPAEALPWKVGIFDSNGKLMPFTNGRTQLLTYLDVVGHTTEPFQFASAAGVPASFRWEGGWLTKVEVAMSSMQRYEGPKVILAMNPVAESIYGLNDQMLAHDGPESLTPVAQHIGAHIYIANVGGPDVFVPGGDAAQDRPAQLNRAGGSGPGLGATMESHMQVDPEMTAALSSFAYRTSAMMQTAATTLGGFANSLNDLARQIHHDLDGNYSLDFDLTPADRDHGVPDVEVRMARRDLKVAILDVVPIGIESDRARAAAVKNLAALMNRAAGQHLSSPDFRVTQRVDYFPMHAGLEPVLPMTCLVEWTGAGRGPEQLSVLESVEDVTLSTNVLQREIHVQWDGHSLTWERDGQLRPGHYVWRVAVHDGNGKILAYREEAIEIHFPRPAAMAVSSLVLGKSCRADDGSVVNGLQRRAPAGPGGKERVNLLVDPMRAADCRVKPESGDQFASSDTLHAFVRIYPSEKLDKRKPESWTAKFVLRSQSGSVESEKDIPFTVDSGSGYLASIQMPLDAAPITSGPHTLDVEMRGPGIHKDLTTSRAVSIAGPANP